MAFLLIKINENESSLPSKPIIIDKNNPVILGRGSLINCSDPRVSRKHAELKLNSDDTLVFTVLHPRPCYVMEQGVPPIKLVKLNEEIAVKVGDYISILPDVAWFRIVSQPLEDAQEIGATALISTNSIITPLSAEITSTTRSKSAMTEKPPLFQTLPCDIPTATLAATITKPEASLSHKPDKSTQFLPISRYGCLLTDNDLYNPPDIPPPPPQYNSVPLSETPTKEFASVNSYSETSTSHKKIRKLPEWMYHNVPSSSSEKLVFPQQVGNLDEHFSNSSMDDDDILLSALMEVDDDDSHMVTEQIVSTLDKGNPLPIADPDPKHAIVTTTSKLFTEISSCATATQDDLLNTLPIEPDALKKDMESSNVGPNLLNTNDLPVLPSPTKANEETAKIKDEPKEEPVESTTEPSTSTSRVSQESGNPGAASEVVRALCQYEDRCYRKNLNHRRQFSHPGDHDYVAREDRPHCPFGSTCYRKCPRHRVHFQHVGPPAERQPIQLPLFFIPERTRRQLLRNLSGESDEEDSIDESDPMGLSGSESDDDWLPMPRAEE